MKPRPAATWTHPKQKKALQRSRNSRTDPTVFTDTIDLIAADCADAADNLRVPLYAPHCGRAPAEGGTVRACRKTRGLHGPGRTAVHQNSGKKRPNPGHGQHTRRRLGPRFCRWTLNEEQMIGNVYCVDSKNIRYSPPDFEDPKFKWRGLKLLSGGSSMIVTENGERSPARNTNASTWRHCLR